MNKYTGKGGQAIKDGAAIAGVRDYDFTESQGEVYGQSQSDVTMNVALIGEPIRYGDTFTLKLKTRAAETNHIDCGTVEVESVSFPVSQDDVLIQTVTVIGRTTPDYAPIT